MFILTSPHRGRASLSTFIIQFRPWLFFLSLNNTHGGYFVRWTNEKEISYSNYLEYLQTKDPNESMCGYVTNSVLS